MDHKPLFNAQENEDEDEMLRRAIFFYHFASEGADEVGRREGGSRNEGQE